MRSILVTGGAGFIGSNFVRAFMGRHPRVDVHVLDALARAGNLENLPPQIREDARFHFWHGDVGNSGLVGDLMGRVDTVMHFAAETHVARSIHENLAFFATDVVGTRVVADELLRHQRRIKRFVHISSAEVYGTALTKPIAEGHPLQPVTPQAAAKCGADRLVYSYWRTYGIPAVILRLFKQYGPYQHLDRCVPRFVTSALDGAPITIHGDGSAARDWCYVGDTCEALLAVLEAPLDAILGEVINLGTGVATDVLSLCHKVVELMGGSYASIEHVEGRAGQADLRVSSTDKAEHVLGWRAKTDLDAGLVRTIDWYHQHESWWRRQEWVKQVPLAAGDGRVMTH